MYGRRDDGRDFAARLYVTTGATGPYRVRRDDGSDRAVQSLRGRRAEHNRTVHKGWGLKNIG